MKNNQYDDDTKPEMRWGVKRRMEFIEFKLLWEGGINRKDLMGQFAISAPQASNDLTQYRENASQNIIYDLSEKQYFASQQFSPQYLLPDADRYLSQLKLISEHLVSPEETWLSAVPSVGSLPIPHRRVEVSILKGLVDAVRDNRSLEVHYHSMNLDRPAPVWRWITPHAFANDGTRWHVRIFCHMQNKFKDFILSRFLGVKGMGEPGALPSDDKYWNEFLDVILIPNPKLSDGQKTAIALDYGMKEGEITVSVRKAILLYFKKRLRLDIAESLNKPEEVPVIIKNRKIFDAALAEASPTA